MARRLTAYESKFMDGLLNGLTQAEAYRQAGYKCDRLTPEGVAKKAYAIANKEYIKGILAQRKKELENAAIWERKHALEMLKKIADADIRDLLTFRTAKTVVARDEETGEPIIDYAHIVDLMDSDDVDGRLIQEVSISKDGTLKVKLHDKLKAAEMANRMCGYNEPERCEVDAAVRFVLGGLDDLAD